MAQENEDGQEKTEEPTERKLQKARDEGQVPRSMEVTGAAVMISSMAAMFILGGFLISKIAELFAGGLKFDRRMIFSEYLLPGIFVEQLGYGLLFVLPILLLTVFVALVSSALSGGFLFSLKAAAPKLSKINPINGIKRMFGMQALGNLVKSLLKFFLVSGALAWVVYDNISTLTMIGQMSLEPALNVAGELISRSILIVTLTLVLIAMIDLPIQRYQFFENQKMTKQEVKDEMKDVEGRPEVRAQIRRKQREMASARMIEKVKDADVVITNPEHFSVALVYDPTSDGAPVLIAKGADLIALRIRNEAKKESVQLFESPDLARALYFTTEINQSIPEELYLAVAQIIAYVYNLNSVNKAGMQNSKPKPKIPDSMYYDSNGKKSKG